MLNDLDGEAYTYKALDSVRDRKTHLAQVFLSENPQDTGNLLETFHDKIWCNVNAYKQC